MTSPVPTTSSSWWTAGPPAGSPSTGAPTPTGSSTSPSSLKFRGQGIGTALLRQVQRQAGRAGTVVRLETRAGGRAEALYRRLGFLRVASDGPSGDEPAVDAGPWGYGSDVTLEWGPEHWLPIHVLPGGREPSVDWFDAGPRRLTDPFFVQAFQRAEHRHSTRPGRPWRRTGTLDELVAEAERNPGLAPDGFVLHMSRCGSTLLAQMLAADPDHLVLSEPPALDGVLRTWHHDAFDEERRLQLLRSVLSVLGRPRHGERRLFVKLDAWHTTMLDVLRRAFPDTPWVFVVRDPVEVLVSQDTNTAAIMVPGAVPDRALNLDLASAISMSPETYAAAVLSAICASAGAGLGSPGPGGMVVPYETLPGALDSVLAHFGVRAPAAALARMTAASAHDAKAPSLAFVPDGPAKQAAADERLRTAAASVAEVLATFCSPGAPSEVARWSR